MNSSFTNTTLMYSQGIVGGGGGGFIQTPTTQTHAPARALVPISSFMVHNSKFNTKDGSSFNYKDLAFGQVVLIGLVRSVEGKTSNFSYTVDDLSGPLIEVRYWYDDPAEVEEFRQNEYIRVCGTLKQFQGQYSIIAFKINKLKSVNQIAVHMLEIATALRHAASLRTASGMVEGFNGDTSMMDTSVDLALNGGLSGLELQITKFIKGCTSDCGASLADIKENFRTFSDARIREVIDFLSSEGHIFSTVDDSHYCYTGLN